MNRELLEKPFLPTQIKQRQGTFGQTLDYLEGHTVTARLNEAFESNWSFRIISHEILENEVVVLGELTAENIKKSQFGCSGITRSKDTGKIISLGSDLKSASTDSLKRCAMLLGIGLHLYSKENSPSASRPSSRSKAENRSSNSSGTNHTSTNHSSTNRSSTTHPNTNQSNNAQSATNHTSTNQNGRISSKQHKYLISLGQEMGLSKHELNRMSIEGYGSAIAYLSKQQASEMIASMRQH